MDAALDGADAAFRVDGRELQQVVARLDGHRAVVDERAGRAGIAWQERGAQQARVHGAAAHVEQREGEPVFGGADLRIADLGGEQQADLL